MPAPSAVEPARKWLHLAPGFLAFALPFVGFAGAVALCGALVAFNLWILPRFGGTLLWRPSELADGEAWGILFYPLALLVVALAAGDRLEILAGAWGMLAFGDAAATLVGRRWGRRSLPWHPGKSWVGSASFVAASWASGSLLVLWAAPQRYGLESVLLATALAALVGAVVESLPWAMDDNVSVTVLGGAALFWGLEAASAGVGVETHSATWGVLAIAILAGGLNLSGSLDRPGAVVGCALALAVLLGGGWRALVLLAFFVGAGTAAGRLRARAQGAGSGTERAAERGAANVLANGVVVAGCGLLLGGPAGDWALLAFGGALATATADTVGGELGQAWGGRTRRVSDGRLVAPGTDGGMSWPGTFATAAFAALVGGLGLAVGLFGPRVAILVAVAGFTGALIDSLLGATLERRGLLDNEGVNCLSTLGGAWIAVRASLLVP